MNIQKEALLVVSVTRLEEVLGEGHDGRVLELVRTEHEARPPIIFHHLQAEQAQLVAILEGDRLQLIRQQIELQVSVRDLVLVVWKEVLATVSQSRVADGDLVDGERVRVAGRTDWAGVPTGLPADPGLLAGRDEGHQGVPVAAQQCQYLLLPGGEADRLRQIESCFPLRQRGRRRSRLGDVVKLHHTARSSIVLLVHSTIH